MCNDKNLPAAMPLLDFPEDASCPCPKMWIVFDAMCLDYVPEAIPDEYLLGKRGNIANGTAGENAIFSFSEVRLDTRVFNTQSPRDY